MWLTDDGPETAKKIQEILSMKIISGNFNYDLPMDAITRDVNPELRGINQAIPMEILIRICFGQGRRFFRLIIL